MNKIVYACNDDYFNGLYLSILSIVRRSKESYAFYLLTGDFSYINSRFTSLSKKHQLIINDLISSYNKKNTFTCIDCTSQYNNLLKGNRNEKSSYSPYTTLRLLIDQYKELADDKILYLDVDTMAANDIKEFFNINLKDNEFAVAHDVLGRWWQHRDYFNAGVTLFNMPICLKTKLLEKSRKMLFERKLAFPDQSALYNCKSKFMFFPGDEMRFNNQKRIMKDNNILIKHFCAHIVGWPTHYNIKQWEIDRVHKYLHNHYFDEDYKLFLDMKRKNNL